MLDVTYGEIVEKWVQFQNLSNCEFVCVSTFIRTFGGEVLNEEIFYDSTDNDGEKGRCTCFILFCTEQILHC